MTKREVVRAVLQGKKPPYVPWKFHFTLEASEKLQEHLGTTEPEEFLHNHIIELGKESNRYEEVGDNLVRDCFGVVWDRSVDKDVGIAPYPPLTEPSLKGYEFPDPLDQMFFADIPGNIAKYGDLFRQFSIDFSLYERAWLLRGMENLMMDFYDQPGFVRNLLRAIADWDLAQITEALKYDIDAVFFGDDWGQQRGLQMGPSLWQKFIYPELARMYRVVREAGKFVMIHSCGDVDELLDDLIKIGVDCFNPFQPEVMDVPALLARYRGRLAFYGGLSTQRTLPYGKPQDVRAESRKLLKLGLDGSYIFAPAHAVEGDVPLENMLAFIEEAKNQQGFEEK